MRRPAPSAPPLVRLVDADPSTARTQFPRDLDNRLSHDLDRAEVLRFARENPVIAQHLALQDRKEKLELVSRVFSIARTCRACSFGPVRRPGREC